MAFSIKTSFGSRSILNDDRSSETAQRPSYDLPYSGSVPNLAQKHDSQSSRPQSLYFSSNGPISLPPPNFPSARSNVSTSSYTSPLDRRRSSDMTVLSKFKVDDGLLNDKYRNRHSMYYGDNHSSKGFQQQQQPQSTYPLVPGDYTSSSSHSRNSSISHSNTTSSYPFTMSHNNNVMMMDPKSSESQKINNSKQASSITPVLGPKPSSNNNNSTNNSSTQKHQKKYVCGHCQRSFTTSGHLARHTRIHTGEKNYECPHADCNARFSRQDNCMQHYRTHLGGRSRGGNSSTGRGTRSRRSNTTSSSSSSTTSARPSAETPNTTIIPPPPPPTSSMVPPQHHHQQQQQQRAAAPQYSNQHLQMPPQYLSHGHNYQQPLSHHHHHHPSIPLVHHHQQSSQPQQQQQQQQAATSVVKPVVSQRHILPMRN